MKISSGSSRARARRRAPSSSSLLTRSTLLRARISGRSRASPSRSDDPLDLGVEAALRRRRPAGSGRRPRPRPGGCDHRAVEPALGLEDAGRVDQQDLRSPSIAMPISRARVVCALGADDRDLLPDQRVDQRRLARVGRADHRDEAGLRSPSRACPEAPPRRRFPLPACWFPPRSLRRAGDRHSDREFRRVMCPGARHHFVDRGLPLARGGQLLERGLGMLWRLALLSEVGPHRRRTNARAASKPPSIEKRADQRLDHVAEHFSLWLAPSSRACLPSRTRLAMPSSRPISAQVSRATSALKRRDSYPSGSSGALVQPSGDDQWPSTRSPRNSRRS